MSTVTPVGKKSAKRAEKKTEDERCLIVARVARVAGDTSRAMDKTAVFRAYVKTIKTRNRAFGSAAVPPADVLGRQRKPARDDFSRRAKDVVNDLGKLTDFLDRHYKDYIDVQSFDQHTAMTDADRDKIDAGAQHIVKTAGQQVGYVAHSSRRVRPATGNPWWIGLPATKRSWPSPLKFHIGNYSY